MFFMIFQLIPPVLLTPTNYCFQDLVTPPSDRLWVGNQTFTKLDMVYSDFVVWPPDMVSVLILHSQKYGDNQIYLYLAKTAGVVVGGLERQNMGISSYAHMLICSLLFFCEHFFTF